MAIFYFDLRPVSRREGDSAIRAWAYATGTRQVDIRTGCVFDFSRKAVEILATGKVGSADWRAAERAERNWNSKVARELILALPCELALNEQVELLIKYARWLRQTRGVAVEWAVHEAPGDPRNRHGHLVLTTRRVSDTGVYGKKTRELDVSRTSGPIVMRWRQRWELITNATLAAAGSDARIDHRSLQARGITRPARLHMGQTQTAQHRAGYDTAAGKHNAAVDEIEKINAELARASSRLRHLFALRQRERVKWQMRIAGRRRYKAAGLGITPAILGRYKTPDFESATIKQGPAGSHRRIARHR